MGRTFTYRTYLEQQRILWECPRMVPFLLLLRLHLRTLYRENQTPSLDCYYIPLYKLSALEMQQPVVDVNQQSIPRHFLLLSGTFLAQSYATLFHKEDEIPFPGTDTCFRLHKLPISRQVHHEL